MSCGTGSLTWMIEVVISLRCLLRFLRIQLLVERILMQNAHVSRLDALLLEQADYLVANGFLIVSRQFFATRVFSITRPEPVPPVTPMRNGSCDCRSDLPLSAMCDTGVELVESGCLLPFVSFFFLCLEGKPLFCLFNTLGIFF